METQQSLPNNEPKQRGFFEQMEHDMEHAFDDLDLDSQFDFSI